MFWPLIRIIALIIHIIRVSLDEMMDDFEQKCCYKSADCVLSPTMMVCFSGIGLSLAFVQKECCWKAFLLGSNTCAMLSFVTPNERPYLTLLGSAVFSL